MSLRGSKLPAIALARGSRAGTTGAVRPRAARLELADKSHGRGAISQNPPNPPLVKGGKGGFGTLPRSLAMTKRDCDTAGEWGGVGKSLLS